MVQLITNYYIDNNVDRQKELDFCFFENLNNKTIDKVIVFITVEDFNSLQKKNHKLLERVVYVITDKRPTYNDYFKQLAQEEGAENINIISNLDIIIPEETIKLLPNYLDATNNVLALTRYNVIDPNYYKFSSQFFNRIDSQDTWIYKGKIYKIDGADYSLGIAGCDNNIAHLISISGYNVINPSLTLKTYHYHLTEIRNYNPHNSIKPPYKLLTPTE